jgi:hypothetical protein
LQNEKSIASLCNPRYAEQMENSVPATRQDLNTRQAAFVLRFVEHGDATRAALEAGYAPSTAVSAAQDILQSPRVALAIARAARPRLARSLPMAIATLDYLAEKAASERVRLEAAKAICDRAGLAPPKPHDDGVVEKPLHEWSAAELRAKVDAWLGELAERAKPINSEETPEDIAELLG